MKNITTDKNATLVNIKICFLLIDSNRTPAILQFNRLVWLLLNGQI